MRASGAAAAGLTALVFAARVGDVESTRLLLDAGANVDDTADEGLSALGFATVRGHVPVALLLLERGANANAADGGYSPLHWAAGSWETTLTTADFTILRDGNDEWNVLPGLREGKLELVKALLKHGADPNLRMKTAPPRAGATKNPQLPELAGRDAVLPGGNGRRCRGHAGAARRRRRSDAHDRGPIHSAHGGRWRRPESR